MQLVHALKFGGHESQESQSSLQIILTILDVV